MLTKSNHNLSIVNKKYNIIDAAKSNVLNTNQSALILNPCNNMNTFGAGFNKIIAEAFPIAKENYHMLGASTLKNKLGYVQFVPVVTNNKYKNQLIVSNMICQTGIISDSNHRPFNYYAFGVCLAQIQEFVKKYQDRNDLSIGLYMPKIHMGVTGANWSIVSEIILDVLKKPIHTFVYES